jgi:hypothetical protein
MVVSLAMCCESYWRLTRLGKQVDEIAGELHGAGQALRSLAGGRIPLMPALYWIDRDMIFVSRLPGVVPGCAAQRYSNATSSRMRQGCGK